MKNHEQGISILEVLIAFSLLAVVVGSVLMNNVRLAETNIRAEVQALEASAAEGIAQLYVNRLPDVGTVKSGEVASALPLQSLSEADRALWRLLRYQISRPSAGAVTITITRSDQNPDPNPLEIHVKP